VAWEELDVVDAHVGNRHAHGEAEAAAILRVIAVGAVQDPLSSRKNWPALSGIATACDKSIRCGSA
jgi:hypothetical protein